MRQVLARLKAFFLQLCNDIALLVENNSVTDPDHYTDLGFVMTGGKHSVGHGSGHFEKS